MASVNITIVVNSLPATSITFTPSGTLTAPVAANTNIGSIAVAPASWLGALVISGTDAASFSLLAPSNGVSELVNTAQLDARTYNLTISAAP